MSPRIFSTSGTVRLACLALLATAACSDALAPPVDARADASLNQSEGRGVFQRYVSIGTSVSMGWASDGVLVSSQQSSWPVQLARLGGRELTTPDIASPGCPAPLAAPLASGVRINGEGAGLAPSQRACAPLLEGAALPAQNLAIAAALTSDALYTTPERQADVFYSRLYPRILPAGLTQVTAMMAQNPKLVSVEFGGNEVLSAREGVAIEGVSLYPYAAWEPLYDAVLDSVGKVTKMAVVVGLTDDVATFPGFRRGAELWADRTAFLVAFNVAVNANCQSSDNLLFVPVRVPVAVGTGLALRAHGQPVFDLNCAAGLAGVKDYVLDPAEMQRVNDLMARMDAHIRAEADRRGYAYFRLGDLYGRADIKSAFSAVSLMTSATPYGPLVSLDGIHPSADGSAVLAAAAARALNARYSLGLPLNSLLIASTH